VPAQREVRAEVQKSGGRPTKEIIAVASHKHQRAYDWLGYLQPAANLGDDNLTLQVPAKNAT